MRGTGEILSLVLAAFLVVAVSPAYAQDFGEINETERLAGPPDAMPEADAVILFDHGLATTELRGLEFKRHVRAKIFQPSGAEKLGEVAIKRLWYDKLMKVEAVVHKSSGETQELDRKLFEEVKQGIDCITYIRFNDLSPGDIIEYRYVIEYYGGKDLLGPEKYFLFSQQVHYSWYKSRMKRSSDIDQDLYQHVTNLPSWYFDSPVFTLESKLVCKLGSDLDYSYTTVNLEAEEAVPEYHRGQGFVQRVYKFYTWQLKNIPPFDPEDTATYHDRYRKAVHFQLFSTVGANRMVGANYGGGTFRSIGKSFQGYLQDYFKSSRRIEDQIKSLTEDASTTRDSIQKVCDWIRLELDTDSSSGYKLRPMTKSLKELFKKKQGMPFEANLALVYALQLLDMDAYPLLISTLESIDFRKTARFDHLLAMVSTDEGLLYIDVASEECQLGTLEDQFIVDEGVIVNFNQSGVIGIEPEPCRPVEDAS